MNNSELETILRHAPQPRPPSDLRDQLRIGAAGFAKDTARLDVSRSSGWSNWLRRWWPALGPAAAALACAAVLTVQQEEIRSLKAQIEAVSPAVAATEPDPGNTPAAVATAADTSVQQAEEIARLSALAGKLQEELARLHLVQTENARLRSQLATRTASSLTPEEASMLEAAKEKAESIQCVNNLKQFGLAVRVWATDNADVTPPSIICMSNELSTPKILVCPADKGREAAVDFNSFTTANCSYEYLAPSAPDNGEPNRVLSRCTIHGNIGLCDGSVQMGVAKNQPERLVTRNGRLYFGEAHPAGSPQDAQRLLMERYGIKPADAETKH